MPSYPGTPAESSFQSSSLGSVRGSQRTEGGGSRNQSSHWSASSGRSQSGSLAPSLSGSQHGAELAVVRTVQVTGTCKAVQVCCRVLWCFHTYMCAILYIQLASGVVVLHYSDGSQLELQSSGSAAFKYTDPQGGELM